MFCPDVSNEGLSSVVIPIGPFIGVIYGGSCSKLWLKLEAYDPA